MRRKIQIIAVMFAVVSLDLAFWTYCEILPSGERTVTKWGAFVYHTETVGESRTGPGATQLVRYTEDAWDYLGILKMLALTLGTIACGLASIRVLARKPKVASRTPPAAPVDSPPDL